MSIRPRLARLVSAGIGAPLLAVAVAGPAAAHGAPVSPVSRSAGCGSEGQFAPTAACRAARSGAEGQWSAQWDNVRVAEVNGRDRESIPDGKLCSGGIEGFGGLDLARADWPSTSLRAGQAIPVSYRGTIAHQGTFRMYVTKDGYTPKQALRWADLEPKPFVTATDPDFADGAYTFSATLPSGKVGRHVLFTIWQNSSTPDTYYSCSDVVFDESAAASASAPARTEVSLGAAARLSNDVTEPGSEFMMTALAGLGLLALVGTGGGIVLAWRRHHGPRRTSAT